MVPDGGDVGVPQRLSLVTLGVADVGVSTAFYERLGWTRSSASVDGVVSFFALGPVALSLYGADALAHDAGVAHEPEHPPHGRRRVTMAINVAEMDDVDSVVRRWSDAGAAVVQPPTTADWGGRLAYVADPDGHLWEIAWNPGFPLGLDGALHLP